MRYIKFPPGLRGLINVGTDWQSSRITASNWCRPDFPRITINKYSGWLLSDRGVCTRILCDSTRWKCAVTFNFQRLFPRKKKKKTTGSAWPRGISWQTGKDRLDKRMFPYSIIGTLQRSSRPCASHHIHQASSTSDNISLYCLVLAPMHKVRKMKKNCTIEVNYI